MAAEGANSSTVPKLTKWSRKLVSFPLASSPAEKEWYPPGRYRSCWKSSSLVQTSFTGTPASRAIHAASIM